MSIEPRDLGFIYLATPYTRYQPGIWNAYKEAARLTGKLLKLGAIVFSPISHSHPVAIFGGIDPLDNAFWISINRTMMEAAECLVVAKMDGWKESKGIAHEIELFMGQDKPVYSLDPATLSIGKLLDMLEGG